MHDMVILLASFVLFFDPEWTTRIGLYGSLKWVV